MSQGETSSNQACKLPREHRLRLAEDALLTGRISEDTYRHLLERIETEEDHHATDYIR